MTTRVGGVATAEGGTTTMTRSKTAMTTQHTTETPPPYRGGAGYVSPMSTPESLLRDRCYELQRELTTEKAAREKAEQACAASQDFITQLLECAKDLKTSHNEAYEAGASDEIVFKVMENIQLMERLVSTDAGKGWVPREELESVKARLQQTEDELMVNSVPREDAEALRDALSHVKHSTSYLEKDDFNVVFDALAAYNAKHRKEGK